MLLDFSRGDAEVFVPDGCAEDEALSRVTHLGIGAHADDLEIMAWHGIRAGHERGARFGAVVCTHGGGAPRSDDEDDGDDASLVRVRREEQRAAARRGRYAVAVQLGHPSRAATEGPSEKLVADLERVLGATRPRSVYTHAPSDRHATHVGVCIAALEALRRLPPGQRPKEVLGCEVWGGLDWLPPDATCALDLGEDDASWTALMGVFASQTRARPYDVGALGRSRANAVFGETHRAGGRERLWLAMDLTPLLREDSLDLAEFVRAQIESFERSVLERIETIRG